MMASSGVLRNQCRTGLLQSCEEAVKVRFRLAVILSEVVTGRGGGHGAPSRLPFSGEAKRAPLPVADIPRAA